MKGSDFMPYKSSKIRLSETQDRRRKLTSEQYEEIKLKYFRDGMSSRQLAAEYGVNKSTILIIVNPKTKQRVSNRIKEHWRDYQKSGTEWADIMREHRHYKQCLYKAGELGNGEEENKLRGV